MQVLYITKMRIFKEQQRFNQWWLHLIIALTFAGWLLLLFRGIEKTDNVAEIATLLLFGILLVLVTLGILSLRLETKIDSSGVTARFFPLVFITRHYKWNEIEEIFVRKYSPFAEYGGWGVRGSKKARAYNVSGNNGIQIVTRDNKKFLIGTKKPEIAKQIISYYRNRQLDLNY